MFVFAVAVVAMVVLMMVVVFVELMMTDRGFRVCDAHQRVRRALHPSRWSPSRSTQSRRLDHHHHHHHYHEDDEMMMMLLPVVDENERRLELKLTRRRLQEAEWWRLK